MQQLLILLILFATAVLLYYLFIDKIYFSYSSDKKYRKCKKCNNIYKFYKDEWWMFNRGTIKDNCKCTKL